MRGGDELLSSSIVEFTVVSWKCVISKSILDSKRVFDGFCRWVNCFFKSAISFWNVDRISSSSARCSANALEIAD